jgi:hypothetical protein
MIEIDGSQQKPLMEGCGNTPLSFRDGPSGPGPESMNTGHGLDFSPVFLDSGLAGKARALE